MRIRPSRPHENRLHFRPVLQVFRERGFHRHRVPRKREGVVRLGLIDEVVYLLEGVRGDDVDALEAGGERSGVCCEGAEEED